MEDGGGGGGPAAPTGCYKCGRPGHWSRDCPSNPNASSDTSSKTAPFVSKPGVGGVSNAAKPAGEKPKKIPRQIPKLTASNLLSDDGLGYVLRHFPRSFKYHGRGHEVDDLGNLLGLYAEWHSRLLPYYSFDQFVHKVETVGSSKRVKLCLRELRERVANGGDPTKLHDNPSQDDLSNYEQVATEAVNLEGSVPAQGDASLDNQETDDFQEELLHEIYVNATESNLNSNELVAASVSSNELVAATVPSNYSLMEETPRKKRTETTVGSTCKSEMTEDQRMRIEANRLKALEKAAARARVSKAV